MCFLPFAMIDVNITFGGTSMSDCKLSSLYKFLEFLDKNGSSYISEMFENTDMSMCSIMNVRNMLLNAGFLETKRVSKKQVNLKISEEGKEFFEYIKKLYKPKQ